MNNLYNPYSNYPYNNQQSSPQVNNNFGYQQPQVQTKQEIIRVNGIEGAKTYQIQPNSAIALFDLNSNTFFVKTSDAGGFSEIKSFSYSEAQANQQQEQQLTSTNFASIDDLNALKEEISALKNDLVKLNKETKGGSSK